MLHDSKLAQKGKHQERTGTCDYRTSETQLFLVFVHWNDQETPFVYWFKDLAQVNGVWKSSADTIVKAFLTLISCQTPVIIIRFVGNTK